MRRATIWKWRPCGETDYRPDRPWAVAISDRNGLFHPDYPYIMRAPTHAEALAWAIEQVEEKENPR